MKWRIIETSCLPDVVLAQARTHMWTAPCWQEAE